MSLRENAGWNLDETVREVEDSSEQSMADEGREDFIVNDYCSRARMNRKLLLVCQSICLILLRTSTDSLVIICSVVLDIHSFQKGISSAVTGLVVLLSYWRKRPSLDLHPA